IFSIPVLRLPAGVYGRGWLTLSSLDGVNPKVDRGPRRDWTGHGRISEDMPWPDIGVSVRSSSVRYRVSSWVGARGCTSWRALQPVAQPDSALGAQVRSRRVR